MAKGLSQLKYCDFIVYSFKGMIIIRIPFSEIYFIKLTEKPNHFLKNLRYHDKDELIHIA